MSQLITTAFVQQYRANLYTLAQQKGSRLREKTRQETQKGKSQFFDQIGAVAAVPRTSRHGDTPQIDTPHSRRMVTLGDYEWADLIDDQDKIRMLIDPQSDYSMAAMWALGRTMDDVIIAAALGNAQTGETGNVAVAHPNSQKIASVSAGAGANLNIDALRLAKRFFDKADIDESIPRFIAVTSAQLYSMLGQTAVTSVDYNSVKALVDGNVDTFLGFKFVRTERLLLQSGALNFAPATGIVGSGAGNAAGYRRCFAWAKDGLISSVGEEMTARISERDDKGYATQVYARMSHGAVRMEETKVVEILCSEA